MATTQFPEFDLAGLRPRRSTLLVAGALVVFEALVLAWYLFLSGARFYDPLYLLLPFVWINVGTIAAWRTRVAPTTASRRSIALAVAGVYGVVLAYAGGLVGPGYALVGADLPTSFRIAVRPPPGWGPALLYVGPVVHLSVIPFKLVGYAALTYLVYATVIDAAGSALGGIVGLFSCVSCTWPIVASVLTGAVGASGAATAAAVTPGYKLSTAIFVVTVVLLYWRPFGR